AHQADNLYRQRTGVCFGAGCSQYHRVPATAGEPFQRGRSAPAMHEDIISKLDQVGEMFRVLLIKTNMRIPYTSIFFELGCGYWDAEPENRLRAAMRTKTRSTNQRSNVTRRKKR